MVLRGGSFSRAIWAAAVSAVILAAGSVRGERSKTVDAARAEARSRLAAVVSWGCQYQNIDLASLTQSAHDLVVIEPIVDGASGRSASKEEVEALKRKPDGGPRIVLAYLSVGAAEEYRPYWQAGWRSGPQPDWLGAENAEWPRSYSVRYWDVAWQQIVEQALMGLVEAGYDGVFLDRVDAFHDWQAVRPQARADMAVFIAALAQRARARNPAFLLVGQNAEPLLRDERYVDAIDAVSKESLLSGLRGQDVLNAREDVEWSLAYLLPARAAGMTILAIEYAQDRRAIVGLAAEHKRLGFIPFFGSRLLDRLP